jgi:opacity protein-like surface antigen
MKLRAPLLGIALLALAASASAQYRGGTVEINPFAGYLFGGTFGHFQDFGVFQNSRVSVEDHVIYGGRVGYNFTSLWEVEVEYAQSDTHLELEHTHHDDLPDERIGDMKFEYFLAYMTLNFGHGRVVPYFTIGSGGANLVPFIAGTFSTAEVRYTAGVGGGVKIFLNPHFALRLDGRSYSTYINDSHTVCGPDICTGKTWVNNFVANGGFIIAF